MGNADESEDDRDSLDRPGSYNYGTGGGDLGSCWGSNSLRSALRGLNSGAESCDVEEDSAGCDNDGDAASEASEADTLPPGEEPTDEATDPELASVLKSVAQIRFDHSP